VATNFPLFHLDVMPARKTFHRGFLYHGTSCGSLQRILVEGLRAPLFLTPNESVAQEYAEAAVDDFGRPAGAEGVGVVIAFERVSLEWLRYDSAAMAEPVAPMGLKGHQMDARASRTLGQYKRHHPEAYDATRGTVTVPSGAFTLSLRAVFSVKCVHPLPPSLISEVRYFDNARRPITGLLASGLRKT
jgi:hypothetical protein